MISDLLIVLLGLSLGGAIAFVYRWRRGTL